MTVGGMARSLYGVPAPRHRRHRAWPPACWTKDHQGDRAAPLVSLTAAPGVADSVAQLDIAQDLLDLADGQGAGAQDDRGLVGAVQDG